MFNYRSLCLLLLLVPVVSCSERKDDNSVRRFVQGFYDWYVPINAKPGSDRASDLALQNRSASFDSHLADRLREDSQAQAKATGDLVGLDFDPFLASQDPCDRYEVVNVRMKDDHYLVDVRGVGGCEKHDAADVVAEVTSMDGMWLFSNFHYPGPNATDRDLLTILKELREERH